MKIFTSKSVMLVSVVAVFASFQSTSAQTFVIDDIKYNVLSSDDKTVEVVKNSYSGDIVIPATVTSDGVTYTVTEIGQNAFDGCRYVTSVKLPDCIVRFNNYAFNGCSGLTTLNLPAELTRMERYALAECQKLTELDLPATKIEYVGEKACYRLKAITELNLPATLKETSYYAFSACTSVKTITMAAAPIKFGAYAFTTMSQVETVNIVDFNALFKCSFGNNDANPIKYAHGIWVNGEKVVDLVVPDGVDEIPGNLFKDCTNFKTVTLPASVTYTKGSSFLGCTNLTDVYCYAVTPPNSSLNTFSSSIYETMKLHVPAESVNDYKENQYWKVFTNILPLDESGIENVEYSSFNGVTPVYNLMGIKIAEIDNPGQIQSLPRGLYIVDGKKYVVR